MQPPSWHPCTNAKCCWASKPTSERASEQTGDRWPRPGRSSACRRSPSRRSGLDLAAVSRPGLGGALEQRVPRQRVRTEEAHAAVLQGIEVAVAVGSQEGEWDHLRLNHGPQDQDAKAQALHAVEDVPLQGELHGPDHDDPEQLQHRAARGRAHAREADARELEERDRDAETGDAKDEGRGVPQLVERRLEVQHLQPLRDCNDQQAEAEPKRPDRGGEHHGGGSVPLHDPLLVDEEEAPQELR
mmetsp:Transcript_105751/g.329618  ORF Transcript_105751/g.329618 Transcript_105751/m.329618 type:complete len:243 (+) Transcript_105751:160-888(+)